MVTAQDIREKEFEKMRIGGYDTAAVDDFLDEIADDLTACQKENTVLKSKMKVLVSKIEEYRANEEALNMAVLSAQKLAVQIENEARERASAMIADADAKAKARIGGIEEEAAAAQKKLDDAKAATEKFFDAARALCATQLRNLDAISSGLTPAPAAPKAPKAPAPKSDEESVDDAVRSIEESVAKIKPEMPVDIDLSEEIKAPAKPKKQPIDRTQTFTL